MTRDKHRRALRAVTAVLSVCALAAPTASAVPAEQFLLSQSDGDLSSPPPPSSIASTAVEEYEQLRSPDAASVPVPVVNVPVDSGFDWGDAGIGATAALALAAIGTGTAFALRHMPRRRHAPQPIR